MNKEARSISNVASSLRAQIERGGERVWKFEDFKNYPTTAVVKELSRLVKLGKLKRLSKGIYYRSKITSFGESKPNLTELKKFVQKKKKIFPSGLSASNLLGLTTQNPKIAEVSTSSSSLPRKLFGDKIVINSRRPSAWSKLTEKEASILDFLRGKALATDLKSKEVVKRVLIILSEDNTYEQLLKVSSTEPPRVRAMLGALGERLNKPKPILQKLKESLNSLSTFDFGNLSDLPNASNWQAKVKK